VKTLLAGPSPRVPYRAEITNQITPEIPTRNRICGVGDARFAR